MTPKVNIYWDNSNIFIGAKRAAQKKGEGFHQTTVRVQFDNLLAFARSGREINAAVAVGSVPPEFKAIWDRIGELGVSVELYERGAGSNTEQGLDQSLQTHMLRAIVDESCPQVAVLLTGDAKGYGQGVGFYADFERMANKGWGVEVLSWDCQCGRDFKDWAKRVGVYIPLEDYYESITFLEGTRPSKKISLTKRSMAEPSNAP